nr:putative ribonuclease H-like domain-containing protein [Tanacetum cinerariifolium]
MSTQQDIYAAGSENRPPMLNKDNYVPWSSRIIRYARSRPNGKMIVDFIKNGPYTDIKRMDANDQAIQTILLGLFEDVYAAVDSCETAKEIWERVRQMMKGSDIGEQEKKAKLFKEWEKFTSTGGESIESYYHRFMQLMNDLKRNKHFSENIASNLKFLNNLQPEWKRHVTIVHQTKNLHETYFTQSYDFLKMNQEENGGIQSAQNTGVQSGGNQNGLVVVPWMANQNETGNVVAARDEGIGIRNQARDAAYLQTQLLISQKEEAGIQLQADEFDVIAVVGDLDEIEEVNANRILMANLQQASIFGTQHDKAPIYDTDGSAEENVSSDTVTASSTGLVHTAKTRRPQPKGKTRNARVPSASKSSEVNKNVTVEEHRRTLLLSKNQKTMSSEFVVMASTLSHLNFDTINDHAKNDLVSSLPKFKYDKEYLCPSCEQGKSKRASHPPKPVPNSKQWLHLLHMDLCGPMRVASISGKRYVLVIVDDYSQYTWVHFLITKDETPKVIKNFLKKIYVRLQAPVIIVRTENETKFKNHVLKEYFDSVGITHETSAAKTPQQNGAVERRNRTLVEAARTIKPDISYLHIFGALCYPKNDREDISKLGAKEAPRAIPTVPVVHNLQAPTASMSFQDSVPQQRNLTLSPTASAVDNVPNAVFEGDLFVNPFGTPSTESVVLYGLKQALRAWYDELSTFLLQNGFSKGTIFLTLFTRHFDDDILVVNQSPSGIFINQSKYVHEILKKYGLNTCDIVGTPMDIKDKLDLNQIGTLVDATKYRSLMYLTSSRSDIVHATCSRRDLPKDIPIDRLEFLRYDTGKRSKVRTGIMPTEKELTLEQSQQAAKPCQGDSSEFYLITGSIYTDQGGTMVITTIFNEREQRLFHSYMLFKLTLIV